MPQNDKAQFFGLLICGVLFLVGCIAGTFSSGFVNDTGQLDRILTEYISFYINDSPVNLDFISAAFDAFKYPLAALFFGLSVLGVLLVPVLSAVRGFMLSYSISAIVRLLGGKGVWLALSVFGIRTLITIPCFFILNVYAYSCSSYIFRQSFSKNMKITASPFNRRAVIVCVICLLVLFASALIDTYLSPLLIGFAASHI